MFVTPLVERTLGLLVDTGLGCPGLQYYWHSSQDVNLTINVREWLTRTSLLLVRWLIVGLIRSRMGRIESIVRASLLVVRVALVAFVVLESIP